MTADREALYGPEEAAGTVPAGPRREPLYASGGPEAAPDGPAHSEPLYARGDVERPATTPPHREPLYLHEWRTGPRRPAADREPLYRGAHTPAGPGPLWDAVRAQLADAYRARLLAETVTGTGTGPEHPAGLHTGRPAPSPLNTRGAALAQLAAERRAAAQQAPDDDPAHLAAADRHAVAILATHGPARLTGRPVHALQLADGRAFLLAEDEHGRHEWRATGPRPLLGCPTLAGPWQHEHEPRPEDDEDGRLCWCGTVHGPQDAHAGPVGPWVDPGPRYVEHGPQDTHEARPAGCPCLITGPPGPIHAPTCPAWREPAQDRPEHGPEDTAAARWDRIRARQRAHSTAARHQHEHEHEPAQEPPRTRLQAARADLVARLARDVADAAAQLEPAPDDEPHEDDTAPTDRKRDPAPTMTNRRPHTPSASESSADSGRHGRTGLHPLDVTATRALIDAAHWSQEVTARALAPLAGDADTAPHEAPQDSPQDTDGPHAWIPAALNAGPALQVAGRPVHAFQLADGSRYHLTAAGWQPQETAHELPHPSTPAPAPAPSTSPQDRPQRPLPGHALPAPVGPMLAGPMPHTCTRPDACQEAPQEAATGPDVERLADAVRDAGTWTRNTITRRVDPATLMDREPPHAFTDAAAAEHEPPALAPARALCTVWQEPRADRLAFSCDCAGQHCPNDPRRRAPAARAGRPQPRPAHDED